MHLRKRYQLPYWLSDLTDTLQQGESLLPVFVTVVPEESVPSAPKHHLGDQVGDEGIAGGVAVAVYGAAIIMTSLGGFGPAWDGKDQCGP